MKRSVKTRGFDWNSPNRTSPVNVATKARDAGGAADCTLAHSIESFLVNALMSCSAESSRTGSGVMMVAVNPGQFGFTKPRTPSVVDHNCVLDKPAGLYSCM